MAPEQITGEKASEASDIYSLGVVLFEMLTGRLPFTAESSQSVAYQIVQQKPPRLTELRPDLPERCERVLLTALAKNPRDRYSTAMALAEAFEATVRTPVPVVESVSLSHPNVPAASGDTGATKLLQKTLIQRLQQPKDRRWAVLITATVILLLFAAFALLRPYLNDAPSEDTSTDTGVTLSARDYNERGVTALAELDYDDAIADFQAAIDLDPEYAAAYFNLGVAYEEDSQVEQARTAYETALTYDSQLLMARYRLSELLLDQGLIDDGFQMADEGLRILRLGSLDLEQAAKDQLAFLLYTTRARAYYLQESLSLAKADLDQALTFKAAVQYAAPAYYYLAKVYEAQGNDAAAEQAWLDVLATHNVDNEEHRTWAAEARTALE